MTEHLTALFEGLRPLWEMSFTAAWAAGVVCLLRLLLKNRAPKRVLCLLWLVVFARLLVPVKLESPVSLVPPVLADSAAGRPGSFFDPGGSPADPAGDPFNPAGSPTDPVNAPADPVAGPSDPVTGPSAAPVQPANPAGDGAYPVVTVPNAASGTPAPAENTSAPAEPEASGFPWRALLAGIWLTGGLGMLGCGAVTWLRLRRRVRFAVRAADRVWEDEAVLSPFILGLFRPRVYLPTGLEGNARRYILCHEFAHMRRLDHLVKPICWLALAVHWFNPAVWLAFLLLSRDMEGACDEAVLRTMGEEAKAGYSYTLLALASGNRVPAPCPLAFDEGDAKGRIKHVLSYRRPALWIVVMSVLAVVVAAVCLLTNPVAEEEPDGTPSPAESEPGQSPSAEPSQAPAENLNSVLDPWMLEVLRGERTFSDYGTDRDIDHLAEMFFGDKPPENLGLWFKLALLDLDMDGAKELVLWPMGQYDDTIVYQTGYLILRQEGDTVRGYHPGWRSMGSLKADGTYSWSSSAANGGTGRAYFYDGQIWNDPITWSDGSTFETGEIDYYVEGQSTSLWDGGPVTEKEFYAAIESQDAKPDPFWYTFEDGTLRARIFVPVDNNVVVPDFLDMDQRLLYRQAETLYTTLFGPSTEMINWWPGPYDLPPADPVEVDGTVYSPATGLFAKWDDLETAVLSVFTQEFWDSHNRYQNVDGTYSGIYTNVDGRTYYLPLGRGNYGTNPNFPDSFHLPALTDTEISFVLMGHYSEEHSLEGESYEERDARIADHWETYIGYPMKLVLTENGWRFDEFHSADTDHALLPYANQAAPNPALTDDPTPAGGACTHGLDHVFVDHLSDGRLVYRCMEDFFPYYPPYPCAYSSESIAEGDYDGDGHIEEIVRNSAGTLMLCDVVPLDGQPVYGGKYGEMKTFTFDPHTLTDAYPDADLSTMWIEPGNELILCVPLRPEPNAAATGTVELRLHYDGERLTEELCSLPPAPSPAA